MVSYVNNKNALFKALEVFDETNNFSDHLAMGVSLLCTEYYNSIDNIKLIFIAMLGRKKP